MFVMRDSQSSVYTFAQCHSVLEASIEQKVQLVWIIIIYLLGIDVTTLQQIWMLNLYDAFKKTCYQCCFNNFCEHEKSW